MTRIFTLLIVSVFLSLAGFAQTSEVVVDGDIATPFKINAASFTSMKVIQLKHNDKEGKEHTYSGISLFDVLTKAGAVPNNQLKGKILTKYLLVSAADGYQVVIALPEIDPAYTDKTIILANQMDGKNLPANAGPFRLIVPGDKKLARSVMRVTSLTVLTAKIPIRQ
ncbi:molybdopterin-dependent oxidoreductase [Mucilaginibacter pallidiroseus]|uniref:Molybdopterin-dependent oxidoreductase n=1 Tax=Mucilaginibacter pallidiroseus TaxID=2599295 RepID=A0A563U864_9SPHI|nr:molybdopterin-dependent oxidoreductase [Mucilaginibacter pallidiroseus]TWR27518.1 molybdopterin-dependent oxidoreductase [Mucilaginibacter pallidiroseus]